MFGFFYNFHNRALGDDLFFRFDEIGTPPPPPDVTFVITDDGDFVITDSGKFVILG